MQKYETSLNGVSDRTYWVRLDKWLRVVGVSSVTAWRWRKRGWLNVINVGGRLFLRPQDLESFERRAAAGEFALPSNLDGNGGTR